MNPHALRLCVLALCWLHSGERAAQAMGIAQLPESNLQSALAEALGVPAAQVVAAAGYDLRAAPSVSGFALARYREGSGAWTFPALAVYYTCQTGTCVATLRLGAAARRLTALALVDLEQPVAAVAALSPVWLKMPVREPGQPARWPVLLVVSDNQSDVADQSGEPAAAPAKRNERNEPSERNEQNGRTEQTLYVISLREANAPKLLHSRTLLERWPEPEPGGRPPPRVGRRVEGLRLGRQGKELVLIVVERDIDSRYSRCLRPEPAELRFRLVESRFQEVADPSAPAPGRAGRGGCR